MYPTVPVGVCAGMRGEGRELPGVGALAIFICRWVCHGVRVPIGGVPDAVPAWLLRRAVADRPTQYCKHAGYFLGARPAALAQKISY